MTNTSGSRDGDDRFAGSDLLLKDLESFSESFWKNEEIGESRVNFLLTLATAVMAGLGALATAKNDITFATEEIRLIALLALLGLLAIGIVTFFRMVRRNCVSEDYKRAMRHIRQCFKERSDGMESYSLRLNEEKPIQFTGGLVDLVAGINGVLVVGFLYLGLALVGTWSGVVLMIVAIVLGVLVGVLQIWYGQRIRDDYKEVLSAAYPKDRD